MKIIGGMDNYTHNSGATTAKAMADAGYEWDEKNGYWCKGADE